MPGHNLMLEQICPIKYAIKYKITSLSAQMLLYVILFK